MDQAQSAVVNANGTAVVTFGPIPTGLERIVFQIASETPARTGATLTIRKNGRFITATPMSSGAASAQGPPYVLTHPGDQLTANWAGFTVGDVCLVTWLYTEKHWSVDQQLGVV